MQSYEFLDIHTHKFYDDGTIFLFSHNLFDGSKLSGEVFFSAGVHPWEALKCDFDKLNYLKSTAVSAIGEIGLDYASGVSRNVQKEVFEEQLKIAQERGLPVVIHCVRAFYDVISQLKQYDLKAVIFHGFIGSPEQAAGAVRSGYYLSFNGRSLKSSKTVESLRQVPLSAIFVETDDEPEHVSQVYEKIAAVRGIYVEQLQAAVAENFNRIFL